MSARYPKPIVRDQEYYIQKYIDYLLNYNLIEEYWNTQEQMEEATFVQLCAYNVRVSGLDSLNGGK